jgi:hypothetical protein
MPYAVLQTDLNTPSVEQLQRAARFVAGLTPADGAILVRDAFGILVKDFSEQQAGALQGSLRVEGVETEVVDQSLLPELPPIKFVHRLECLPEHLMIHDPLGRAFPVEWKNIMLIAAGSVRLTDFVRQQEERPVVRYTAGGTPYRETEYETFSREERNFHGLAEMVITGAVLRFCLDAGKFNFSYLGERKTKDVSRNLGLVIQDAIQFCPNAARNRGAEAIRLHSEPTFAYPSKNAFHEEIVWMLWQMKKLQ